MSQIPSPSTNFNQPAHPPRPITLDRATLNRALFIGSHYKTDTDGRFYFTSDSMSVSLNHPDMSSLTVECVTESRGFIERIALTFQKGQNNPNHLTFISGETEHHGMTEPVNGAERVADLLTCLYRQVRQAADPKWRNALAESVGDSLSGGACISMMSATDLAYRTGRLPTIKANQSGQISYTPPRVGNDKICTKDCGQCRIKFPLT